MPESVIRKILNVKIDKVKQQIICQQSKQMQKLKVYLTKQNRHNKSTIEKMKQKMLKSKSNVFDVDYNDHNSTHSNSQSQMVKSNMNRNNQNSSLKKRLIISSLSNDHNKSLQQINQFRSEIKSLIKLPNRYDNVKQLQKNNKLLNCSKKNSKLTTSQSKLNYQTEKKMQIERLAHKVNKSEKNLDSILYKKSNQSSHTINDIQLQFKPILPQKASQKQRLIPTKNKNSQAQKYPSKKRSKSANPEHKKNKQQKKEDSGIRNSSLQKITKKIEKASFMNEKINQKIRVQRMNKDLQIKSMFRTRKGVQIMNPNKVNQDRFYIKQNQQISSAKNINIYAVADGHGPNGHFVSHLIMQYLHKRLQVHLKQNKTIKFSLQRAFSDIQSILLKNIDFNADFSGSTLVTLVIQNSKKLICANAGDSRAIVARQLNKNNWEVIRLSNDHKPHLLQQKSRILAQGGRIQTVYDQKGKSIGPLRVWLPKKQLQGLAMSRSLGDNISKPIGVTHEPQILTHVLTNDDKFILLASDGVWQFLSNYQILSLIIPYYKQNRLQDACQALMKEAYNSWTTEDNAVIDDITFILIFLHPDNHPSGQNDDEDENYENKAQAKQANRKTNKRQQKQGQLSKEQRDGDARKQEKTKLEQG